MQNLNIILNAPAQKGGDLTQTIIFMGLIFIVFYFFMVRPQQKKLKNQKKFVDEMKKGDYVITNGGIHGKIDSIDEKTLVINSEGTRLKIEKSAISSELSAALNK
jgi:preprotein translocase subunit YajC